MPPLRIVDLYAECCAIASAAKITRIQTPLRNTLMNAKDAIKYALESTHNMVTMYLGDLSDADLLVRPAPGANHIAWQLGQLIAAEAGYFLSKAVSYTHLRAHET